MGPTTVSAGWWEEKVSSGTGQWRGRGVEEGVLQGSPEDFAMWLSRTNISLLPSFHFALASDGDKQALAWPAHL